MFRDPLFLLRFFCAALFAGRAWGHLRWDPPFRALLWDKNMMEGVVTTFTSMTWDEYIVSAGVDQFIQKLAIVFGLLYLLCAVLSFLVNKERKVLQYILIAGTLGLTFLAFLYHKEKFYHIAQFFEYSLQLATPLALIYVIRHGFSNKLLFILKVLTAVTFSCHGLYAIGYYPVPGVWLDMVMRMLGGNEDFAYSFLYVAGILDFIMSIALFFSKTVKVALLYLIFWGLATALTRVFANLYSEIILESLAQYLHQFIYRLPHFGIPFLLFMLQKRR